MLFSSDVFILVFLPIMLGLYYAVAGNRNARIGLLVARTSLRSASSDTPTSSSTISSP